MLIRTLTCLLAASTLMVTQALAQSSNYPSKQIRVLVPYAPGGGTDLLARPVTQKLGEVLKVSVVYDNRGGGGGILATELVAKAAPDGYTLLIGATGSHTVNPVIFTKLPFDPIKDFAPITIMGFAPNILVANAKFAPHSVSELIAYAKANPGKVNFGSAGSGSAQLQLELFQQMAGVKMLLVPYKGTGPSFTALLAGEVDVLLSAAGVIAGAMKEGRVRALAQTGMQRLPALPDVPTINESGLPGYDTGSWYGVLAPAGTPRAIITTLNTELVNILRQPDIAVRYSADGAYPIGNTPEQFAEQIRSDLEKWTRVAKAAGMKPESL